jgi:hypothetical protein
MVIARGGKQHCFHSHTEGFSSAREKNMPNCLRAGGAARLPRHDDFKPTRTQGLGKNANLGGFACALSTFEANEQSGIFGQCFFLTTALYADLYLTHIARLRNHEDYSQKNSSSFNAPVAF